MKVQNLHLLEVQKCKIYTFSEVECKYSVNFDNLHLVIAKFGEYEVNQLSKFGEFVFKFENT